MIYLHCCSYSLASKDVYEDLWNMNLDIANKTLQLDFLQQMQTNNLQAERYVSFTLQDISYVQGVTKMLKMMRKKVRRPTDIRDFMTRRYTSYKKFLDLLNQQYFLQVRAEILQYLHYIHDISIILKFHNIFLTTGYTFYQTNTSHEEISSNLP